MQDYIVLARVLENFANSSVFLCFHFISLCLFVAEKDNIRQLSTVKGADSNMKNYLIDIFVYEENETILIAMI